MAGPAAGDEPPRGQPQGCAGWDGATVASSPNHSWLRKARFAGTLTSIFGGYSLVTPAKDYYLEKFGANPMAMGILFIFVSFFTPINEIFSGRMQNKDALSWLFPVGTWGRKAPWLLTHIVLLALVSAVLYLPPDEHNPFVLHAWFLVMSVAMMWTVSTTLIAFESSRQEIYPFNEDRSSVEMYCKVMVVLGLIVGLAPMLVLLANSALTLRLGASVFWVILILAFGLQAQPVWLEAKSATTQEASNVISDLKEAWASDAFRQLCFVRLYDGLYQGLLATNLFYYVTYIMQITGVERSIWIVLVGLANVSGEMLAAAIVARLLRERSFSYQLKRVVVRGRLLSAMAGVLLVAPMWLYGSDPLEVGGSLNMSRLFYLIYSFVTRVLQSPFTFWRVSAQCWVVDEDIQEGHGRRREAAFIGVASAAQNFARALGAAVTFLGYGIFGLDPGNCDNRCREAWNVMGFEFEATSEQACIDLCAERSVLNQPDQLRMYIRGIFIIGVTVCDLLVTVHTVAFPINGIRLARLYNKQILATGGTIEGVKPQPTNWDIQEQVRSSPGRSKVVMLDFDAAASVSHLDQLRREPSASSVASPPWSSASASAGKKGLSVSVIFSPLLREVEAAAAAASGEAAGPPPFAGEAGRLEAMVEAAEDKEGSNAFNASGGWEVANEEDYDARSLALTGAAWRRWQLEQSCSMIRGGAADGASRRRSAEHGGSFCGGNGPEDSLQKLSAPRSTLCPSISCRPVVPGTPRMVAAGRHPGGLCTCLSVTWKE